MAAVPALTQILYEIAMDIGIGMDRQAMLKRAIQTMARRLSCLGGIVLAQRQDGARQRMEEVFVLPRNIRRTPAYAAAIDRLVSAEGDLPVPLEWAPPRTTAVGDVWFHRLVLPGYGILVLLKSNPLDVTITGSLRQVCGKLAVSCVACENAEALVRSREDLRESEQRLALAANSARMGVWDWDIVNNKMTWDERMFELYGITPKPETYGLEIWENGLHPEDKTLAWECCQAALRGEKEYDTEFRAKRTDGTVHHIKANGVVLRNQDGTPIRMLGVNYDITERKRAAEALQASEERLRQAEKMTAIGQLAGGVAHDFNNQLAAIMGYADLLADHLEESDLKRHAQNIVVSAQRAADLTQQLLAFSRKGKYLSVPVAANAILGEVVMILERSVDKRVRIAQILKASPCVVMGDPSQLQNALLNVALNARDAMPRGGELTFETDVTTLDAEHCRSNPYELVPGQYLRISVADTGCGMSDEVKKHLFEPFFTTKQPGQGTGMGLASVYGAVRNHHGAINVYSEVGRGTTVRIYLPLASDAVTPAPANADVALTPGAARILVVDDEKAVREMAADVLRSLGYTVATCADGREAVEYYRANMNQVDLVVLDMVMPQMGGRETFLAMRRINPRIRALLSSGYSLNGEAQRILDEGVLGFVGKPYRRAELSHRVAEALERKP